MTSGLAELMIGHIYPLILIPNQPLLRTEYLLEYNPQSMLCWMEQNIITYSFLTLPLPLQSSLRKTSLWRDDSKKNPGGWPLLR